jgi:uncharacterized protein involved in exopolysaccharide biosynthesis
MFRIELNMSTVQGGNGAKPDELKHKVVYVSESSELVGNDEDIDLGRLIWDIWDRRWWIAGLTAMITALAVTYSLLATAMFRAEAVMIPRESIAGSRLASGLSQFGGLADLAGINIGSGAKQEPIGVLRSRGFSQRFIEQNDLTDVLTEALRGPLGTSIERDQSDIGQIVDDFRRSVLSISEDKKTGLVTVAIEWRDAMVAADWANKITRQINAEARMRALDESNRNISYLQGQLAGTETVSLQQAIARLLESEMQKVMIAQGTDEFAFRVVDEAHPPPKRFRPKRSIIVALAFMIGLLFSTIGVLVFDVLRNTVVDARARIQGQSS